MSTPAFDPQQYKAGQRHEWGVSAAGWRQYWTLWEQAAQPVNERLVALADIQTGHRVLDIAPGLGAPAFTAAQRVGPAGWGVATDLAPAMLALAREEASRRKIRHIEFREMDAEHPDVPAQSFQAILCRLGLMFLPHLPTALVGLRQLLVSGGRFAAAVWGPPDTVPFTSVPMGIIRQRLHVPPPSPGTPGTFTLADAHVLTQTFTQAGFTEVSTERLTITFTYPSVDIFVQEREATSASIRQLLGAASPEDRTAIWHAVSAAITQYQAPDGVLRIPNDILCVVGRA